MAQLNFNLLNPPGSENIANAFVKGMDQAQAERRSERALQLQDAQIQQSLRQGRMEELKFEKLQRDEQALNNFYQNAVKHGAPNDPIQMEDLMLASGVPQIVQTGLTARMKRLELEAERKRAQEAMFPGGVPAAPTQPSQPAATNALTPSAPAAPVANALAPQSDNREAQINEARRKIASGIPAVMEAGKIELRELMQQPRNYVIGDNLVSPTGSVITTVTPKAPAPPAMVAEYKFAQTPEGGNFQGSFQDFVTARAKAGRAPAQPVAPTITQIQDPTDNTRMITIDARRYQGGGLGSPGVIGATGKTPKATADAMKVEAGQSTVADIIDNLRTSYENLDKARAIPSTGRSAVSNVLSSIQASGLGQTAGRVAGTPQQADRDVIASSRIQLLNAIKQATGMTAQQLNSNVELQTWLKAVTDPSQSIEAVNSILDNIQEFVAKGGKAQPKPTPNTPAAPAASTGGTWQVVR